jgi:hypothetical protein
MTTKPQREKKNVALSDEELDKVSGGVGTSKGGGGDTSSLTGGGGKPVNPLTLPKPIQQ